MSRNALSVSFVDASARTTSRSGCVGDDPATTLIQSLDDALYRSDRNSDENPSGVSELKYVPRLGMASCHSNSPPWSL
jgi:hypothetical protein